MMISRRDSNKTIKKILAYVIAAIFFVALWSPFKSFVTPLLESTGLFSSRAYTYTSSVFKRTYLYAASNESFYQENLRLQDELTAEKLKYLELAILKDELHKYETLSVGLAAPATFAKRIGVMDTFAHDTFRINKGGSDGLLVGEMVVGLGNTLIGTLSEVGEKTSLVALLWNGNEVFGRTSASGTVVTLTGVDDGVYRALVPHEITFQIGDVILHDYNPNLIIGVVKEINNNEEDRFKEILVHVPFHPRMIDVVRIDRAI